MGSLPAAAADVRQDGHGGGRRPLRGGPEHAKEAKGVRNDVELDAGLRRLVEEFKAIVADETGREFPQDPTEQLTGGIEAVFGSWDNKRAIDYRRKNKIDDSLGTVNIQAMVFGNKGDDSGTGVAFTATRPTASPPYGDYLVNAQGEDVVAGIRNTMKLEEMGDVQPRAWEELQEHMQTLERHYRDMCDIEFTVEQGKLGCSRPGSASAPPSPSGSWPTT